MTFVLLQIFVSFLLIGGVGFWLSSLWTRSRYVDVTETYDKTRGRLQAAIMQREELESEVGEIRLIAESLQDERGSLVQENGAIHSRFESRIAELGMVLEEERAIRAKLEKEFQLSKAEFKRLNEEALEREALVVEQQESLKHFRIAMSDKEKQDSHFETLENTAKAYERNLAIAENEIRILQATANENAALLGGGKAGPEAQMQFSALRDEIEALRKSKSELEARLQSSMSELEVNSKLSRSSNTIAELERALEEKKTSVDEYRMSNTALENEIAALREKESRAQSEIERLNEVLSSLRTDQQANDRKIAATTNSARNGGRSEKSLNQTLGYEVQEGNEELADKIDQMQRMLDEQRNELHAAEDELARLKRQDRLQEDGNDLMQQRVDELEKEIAALRLSQREARIAGEDASRMDNKMRDRQRTLEREMIVLREERNRLTAEIAEKTKKIDSLHGRIEALEEVGIEHRRVAEDRAERNSQLEESNAILRDGISRLTQDVDMAHNSRAKIEAELAKTKLQLEEKDAAIQVQLQTEIEELRAQSEQRISDIRRQATEETTKLRESHKRELQKKVNRLLERDAELKTATSLREQLMQRLEQSENSVANQDAEVSRLRDIVDRALENDSRQDRIDSLIDRVSQLRTELGSDVPPQNDAPLLFPEAPGAVDDLKIIASIDQETEASLNTIGVYFFWQIADWSAVDVHFIEGKLGWDHGVIDAEGWVFDAMNLAAQPGSAKRPTEIIVDRF